MEYLFIYLLQIANNLEDAQLMFGVLFIAFTILWVGAIGAALQENEFGEPTEEDKEDNTSVYKYYLIRTMLRKGVIFCFILLITVSLIPTKQTLLLMGGTYLAKKTVSSEVMNTKLSKINAIIDIQLDKYLKELQGKQSK